MAALDDTKAYAAGQMTANGVAITPAVWEDLKPIIAMFFWKWYDGHKDLVLLNVGWWFINVKIKVQDLDNLFALLFGPEPTTL